MVKYFYSSLAEIMAFPKCCKFLALQHKFMSLQPPSWLQDTSSRSSAITQTFCTAPFTDHENGNRVKLLRPPSTLSLILILANTQAGHPQKTNTRSQLLGIYPASVYAPR